MRPDKTNAFHFSGKGDKPPPSRSPSWGQPAVEEPIIDAARISLRAFGYGRSPRRTLAMFLWLRLLRPALTLAVWMVVGWYAWPYVLGAQTKPEVVELLVLYGFIVSFIVIVMLMIAPLRYLKLLREQAPLDDDEPSSLFALASYMGVPPSRLSAWQRSKQLVVHHNASGALEKAVDSGYDEPQEPRLRHH